MGFWETFRESYRAARIVDLQPVPPEIESQSEWAPSDAPPEEDFDGALRESERALHECEAVLKRREEELAEAKQLVVDLAAQMGRLEEELKTRGRQGGNKGGDEKYRKLRRLVIKKVHPDRASSDEKLAAMLGAICKEINAEIDRIDKS